MRLCVGDGLAANFGKPCTVCCCVEAILEQPYPRIKNAIMRTGPSCSAEKYSGAQALTHLAWGVTAVDNEVSRLWKRRLNQDNYSVLRKTHFTPAIVQLTPWTHKAENAVATGRFKTNQTYVCGKRCSGLDGDGFARSFGRRLQDL